jgi:hypothetical protein
MTLPWKVEVFYISGYDKTITCRSLEHAVEVALKLNGSKGVAFARVPGLSSPQPSMTEQANESP